MMTFNVGDKIRFEDKVLSPRLSRRGTGVISKIGLEDRNYGIRYFVTSTDVVYTQGGDPVSVTELVMFAHEMEHMEMSYVASQEGDTDDDI